MKYYLLTDTHGYYDEVINALTNSGYFADNGKKLIVICGDLLDRGDKAQQLEAWAFEGLKNGEIILVKGNHEDLAVDFMNNLNKYLTYNITETHHYKNGTVKTFLDLTNFTLQEALSAPLDFYRACKNTLYFKSLIPLMVDYYESKNYLFVHGWIPFYEVDDDGNRQKINWRKATTAQWKKARWDNGMSLADIGLTLPDKTIVCGHHNCSYGHSVLNKKCSEFGQDAIFDPYYSKGIIAFDACTAYSGKMNCLVLEDEEI